MVVVGNERGIARETHGGTDNWETNICSVAYNLNTLNAYWCYLGVVREEVGMCQDSAISDVQKRDCD